MFRLLIKIQFIVFFALVGSGSWTHARQKPMNPTPKKQALQQVRSWIDDYRALQKSNPSTDTDLKIDFLFRVASGLELRYDETPESILEVVRTIQEQEKSELQKRGSPLFVYLTHLTDCLEKDREPAEPILNYIHEYLKKSLVSNPLSLADYGDQRDYRASGIALKAQPLAPETN